MRISGDYLDSLEKVLELGADEGVARVGRVDVQPDLGGLADWSDLVERVERTTRSRAQCTRDEERHEAGGSVLLLMSV